MAEPIHDPKPPQKEFLGVVKAVLSGDTIVLIPAQISGAGQPPKRELTFSNVQAPRLGYGDKRDDSFAWESREFLRKKCIGKRVTFTVDHQNQESHREYGVAKLDGEILSLELVREGWARVRPAPDSGPRNELHQQLLALEEEAKAEKRGVHQDGAEGKGIRPQHSKINVVSLFDKWKGKTMKGVVEHIRDGSTVRLTVLPNYHNVLFRLSGIRTPNVAAPNSEEKSEPYGPESKFFLEVNVLHRDVDINFRGVGKSDDFWGVLSINGLDPVEGLLTGGLGRFVEWNAPAELAEKYRACENSAKAARLGLWKNAQADSPALAARKVFTGVVRDIQNSGAIVVEDSSVAPTIRRSVFLSNLNVPKLGDGRDREDEPFAWEAKELLRSSLIGKEVEVRIDYVRQGVVAADTQKALPDREFATISIQGSNISLALLEKGYARTAVHKADERSLAFDLLVTAERRAQSKKLGVFSTAEAPKHHIKDLSAKSTDTKKVAKQQFSFLQRDGRVQAIVEFVFNASRFKVFIPKESCVIVLVLEGLKTPSSKAATATEPAQHEPYAAESLDFARRKLHLHDVEIVVDSQDKVGNFIGSVFVDRKNFSVELLELGFAKLLPGVADRSKYARELIHAEEGAKRQKLRIWENYDPEEVLRKQKEADEQRAQRQNVQVSVTEIGEAGSFFAIFQGEENKKLEAAIGEYNAKDHSAAPPPTFAPKKDELVMVKFEADGKFYRGRVTSVFKGQKYAVSFVDFGNQDTVSLVDLRPINDALKAIAPQAIKCRLAFIEFPPAESEYAAETIDLFSDLVYQKVLPGEIEYRNSEVTELVLTDPESHHTINALLVKEGLAVVKRKAAAKQSAVVAKLLEAQEHARRAHLRAWRFGDIDWDE